MAEDPLGDGISRVELLDVMGDDLRIVNAARVSFDKWKEEFDGNDEKLLKYLAEHNHWTPFAHPQLCFRITAPLFVAREWFRHTVGFARNEVSGRYVTENKQFYIPDSFRYQAKHKKQGSDGEMNFADSMYFMNRMSDVISESAKAYQYMIDQGMAGEMARMILPQSMYTKWIETGSLAAYARLCKLRVSEDAQEECRKFAEHIDLLIEDSGKFNASWPVLRNS